MNVFKGCYFFIAMLLSSFSFAEEIVGIDQKKINFTNYFVGFEYDFLWY